MGGVARGVSIGWRRTWRWWWLGWRCWWVWIGTFKNQCYLYSLSFWCFLEGVPCKAPVHDPWRDACAKGAMHAWGLDHKVRTWCLQSLSFQDSYLNVKTATLILCHCFGCFFQLRKSLGDVDNHPTRIIQSLTYSWEYMSGEKTKPARNSRLAMHWTPVQDHGSCLPTGVSFMMQSGRWWNFLSFQVFCWMIPYQNDQHIYQHTSVFAAVFFCS